MPNQGRHASVSTSWNLCSGMTAWGWWSWIYLIKTRHSQKTLSRYFTPTGLNNHGTTLYPSRQQAVSLITMLALASSSGINTHIRKADFFSLQPPATNLQLLQVPLVSSSIISKPCTIGLKLTNNCPGKSAPPQKSACDSAITVALGIITKIKPH